MTPSYAHALIIGAGHGLSASLARQLSADGMRVTLAARTTDDLADLAVETGAAAHPCDAADHRQVAGLFAALDATGAPDVVIYNAAARQRGPVAELDPEAVAHAVQVTALGAFYAAREAAKRMEP
ncbi:MAG: SDR family NAD(P)-dependent oxidoreductase, partial [Pseudomonadota bacterium]